MSRLVHPLTGLLATAGGVLAFWVLGLLMRIVEVW